MLNSQALTTVARFKSFAGITVVTFDTKIEILINVATDFIERFCDRRFLETTYTTQEYDGPGSDKLFLRQYPVDSRDAFTLEERDSGLNENSWSSIDTKLYHIDYTNGIIELAGGYRFVEQPKRYRVTYTAGYAFDNTTPGTTLESLGIGDLEYATWKIVNDMYQDAGSASGVDSESIGNYSVTYGDYMIMSPEIKFILNKYKRPHLM